MMMVNFMMTLMTTTMTTMVKAMVVTTVMRKEDSQLSPPPIHKGNHSPLEAIYKELAQTEDKSSKVSLF